MFTDRVEEGQTLQLLSVGRSSRNRAITTRGFSNPRETNIELSVATVKLCRWDSLSLSTSCQGNLHGNKISESELENPIEFPEDPEIIETQMWTSDQRRAPEIFFHYGIAFGCDE